MKPNRTELRLCYILAYRDPTYIRSRSLLAALERMDGIKIIHAINRHKGLFRYVETLVALLRVRYQLNPDCYILGFRGHEISWLVRLITYGKPLIIDALMSPYAALIEERKMGTLGAILARVWRPFEYRALHRADGILTDTLLHAQYQATLFGLSASKFCCVPVGAIEPGATSPASSAIDNRDSFIVLYYGSFLPLHGIATMVDAATLLRNQNIRFLFIGGTRAQSRHLHKLCSAGGVVNYSHRRWMNFDELVTNEIPAADLCLGGPFGGTPQALRVVTGKTTQSLALGKVTVIGCIDEDFGFIDKVNCLLVDQDNPQQLADAILWAAEHRNDLKAIGDRGHALYTSRFSIQRIEAELGRTIHKLCRRA